MARLVETHGAKWTKARVQCYVGISGLEEPQSFDLGAARLNVLEVVDRWRTPQHEFYKTKVGNGKFFLLRRDKVKLEWEVVPFNLRR